MHADIAELDAVVLEGFDGKANVLGAKSLGELGNCRGRSGRGECGVQCDGCARARLSHPAR